MILFPVFSVAVLCLWSLLLTSGPIYAPVLSIPALVSPVLTPLLSPIDGPTILILIEVCDVTVPITFPICDPSDAPLPPSSPPIVTGSYRAIQLVAGLLVFVYVGIMRLCTENATRLMDEGGSVTSSDRPAHSSFPSLPLPSREVGPNVKLTPLLRPGAPGSFPRQVPTQNTGVNTSGRSFRPSPADSGYESSPLFSRRAPSKQQQSRLRIVTNANVDSPVPPGTFPAVELGSGDSGDDTPLEGPSSTPLFSPPTYQGSEGGWTSCVAADDPFYPTGTIDHDSAPPVLLGRGIAATLSASSKPTVENPPFTPYPPKNRISGLAGFSPVLIEGAGVPDRKSAWEARDAFLRLQAEHGHAAPSRLYCDPASERSTASPARTPNIQALRDILESKKAVLRRLSENRSAWLSPPEIRSRSLSKSLVVEWQARWTTLIPSAASRAFPKSLHSLEQGLVDSEESKSTFDLPADMTMLVDEEMPFSSTSPSEANTCTGRSAPVVETLDDRASTSIDIGLRLLLQAISERGEESWYLDSQTSNETTVSVDLTMGQAPSFLDDIPDLSIYHSSQPATITGEQGTQPPPPVPVPTTDALLEDTAIANDPSLSPPLDNPITCPPTPPFETSLSSGRIDSSLKGILRFPAHRFSRPVAAFEAHDACDLSSSSSSDGLGTAEDTSLLMDQSAPPSPIGSPTRPGSPIPPFQYVISRIRSRRVAPRVQKDQVSSPTENLEFPSAGRSGRLETSMSLERIADLLSDIWAPRSSNVVCFEGDEGISLFTTSSADAICVPEDMSFLVDQSIPRALFESSPGPATSAPLFEDAVQTLPQIVPPPNLCSTVSGCHSQLDLGSPYASRPSRAPPVSSCPRSGSTGNSFFMEVPDDMSLLLEESLGDLAGNSGSFY